MDDVAVAQQDLLEQLTDAGMVPFGERLTDLAAERGERTAVHFIPQDGDHLRVSWGDLDRRSNQVARLLAQRGVDGPGFVVIGLANSPGHYVATFAAWKLGACVLPMRWDLPVWERDRMLDLAEPTAIVADWDDLAGKVIGSDELAATTDLDDSPLPVRVANPAVAIGSGGSTGSPKIVVTPSPGAAIPGAALAAGPYGWLPEHTHLICGPLYHMSPFWNSHLGLFEGQTLVTFERFDAARAIDLIERYGVNCSLFVPTMLTRMARVPGIEQRDLSSLVSIVSGGAPLPGWVHRKWIDLIGAERVWEAYGSTENHGNTLIRGDDWLQHPGSVGRPLGTIVRILDEDGNELPAGEIGEVYMKRENVDTPSFEYIGADARRTSDGLAAVGDLGWLDEDGYLYIADRRSDMIISGGANIYPAEIEVALSDHAEVVDVAVVGLPDDDWGQRVHAIVQPRDVGAPPPDVDLRAHCRDRLARYKIPKTFEFVERLPRSEIGKLRRSQLAAERGAHPTPTT